MPCIVHLDGGERIVLAEDYETVAQAMRSGWDGVLRFKTPDNVRLTVLVPTIVAVEPIH